MRDRAFYNADGDLCVAPQLGELEITTECGIMRLRVGEIAILPRALKFTVRLLSPTARGWIAESTGQPFKLPDRGPIGSAGLADERHFQVRKQIGVSTLRVMSLYQDEQQTTSTLTLTLTLPFDVVAHDRVC